MSQREKTIAALRGLVAGLMPPSGRMVWTTDELVQLIVTVVDKTAEGMKELELEQASRVPSESGSTGAPDELSEDEQECVCGHTMRGHAEKAFNYACCVNLHTSSPCPCSGFQQDVERWKAQQNRGSTGGAPTREELAKIVYAAHSHPPNQAIMRRAYERCVTCEPIIDAILARWPAASRVPTGDKA